tara:strand:+ start:456 stop:689 length:234 start_codon:yes stop_codon:yes gene_type:complete
MRASDRIKYFSIVSKINSGQLSDIQPDEYSWLQENPHILRDMNLSRKKEEILQKSDGIHGTIEEILFSLDLSDRMYR